MRYSVQKRRKVLTEAWSFVRPGGRLVVVSRKKHDIDKQASEKGWQKHKDGYWSNQKRGMFQKEHDSKDLEKLASHRPDAKIEKHPSISGFAYIVLHR